ncbi:MAG TPA: FHA domain-containing protein [Propionibacteriaceae bacterium]
MDASTRDASVPRAADDVSTLGSSAISWRGGFWRLRLRFWSTPMLVTALVVVAVVLAWFGDSSAVRAFSMVAALCVVPGLAVLPRRLRIDSWVAAGISVALSTAITAALALLAVWADWWHPIAIGTTLLLLSAAGLIWRERVEWIRCRATRLEGPSPAPSAGWLAILDDGRETALMGRTYVGRRPQLPITGDARALALIDDARTVSRTHLALIVADGRVQVEDQGSGNGTTVTSRLGVSVPCPPGQRLLVDDGGVVSFGQRSLRIAAVSTMAEGGTSGVRSGWRRGGLALGLVVAAGLWILALDGTDTTTLGDFGLLPALPVPFYVAVALTVGVLIWGVVSRTAAVGDGWMTAYAGVLVLMLYGTPTLVEAVPRLPWIYKHIAVTRYIEQYGTVNPDIDIYQRWPGFFAWSALVAQLMGRPDPLGWAGLAEPFFALLGALLVLGIARTISLGRGFTWTATLFFCLGNWINQNYFAPQALAYDLYLFVALVLLTLATATPRSLGSRVEAVLGRLLRVPGPWTRSTRWVESINAPVAALPRAWLPTAVLLAFAVAIASHQLTPYLSLLVLLPLFLLGYFRPAWLVVAMGVLTLLYLAPNLAYINDKYGVLSSFNPLDNATSSLLDRSRLSLGEVWSGRASYAITGLLYGCAVVGLVRRARASRLRQAVVVGWMMVAPALLLAVQSYGGEGRLRVYLFSLPWCAIAAGWAFWPGEAALRRAGRVVLSALLGVLCALFAVSYYSPERETQLAPADVSAALWLDDNSRPGDILLSTSPRFPRLVGANYANLVLGTDLSTYPVYYSEPMTRDDVENIARERAGTSSSSRTLVVFSVQQDEFDARHGLYGVGELAGLEEEIRRDPADRIIYDRDGVRVYQMG